jgi:hypothetical protein
MIRVWTPPVPVLFVDRQQEKLNEAVVVMNKSLQVSYYLYSQDFSVQILTVTGNQYPEHERRACCADVQELPIQRAVPS